MWKHFLKKINKSAEESTNLPRSTNLPGRFVDSTHQLFNKSAGYNRMTDSLISENESTNLINVT